MSEPLKIFSQRCWVDGKLQPATVHIRGSVISAVNKTFEQDALDVGDDILMPGLIDAHVHINEPGRTDWEGFETATRSAAAGGITTLVDMPLNSSPVTISVESLEEKKRATLGKMQVNIGFYGGLVPANAAHMDAICRSGVLGVKCFLVHSGIDEFPNTTKEDLELAMPVLAAYRIPLLVHAEIDREPAVSNLDKEPTSYKEYVKSRPDRWETEAIDMMIGLCRKYNCPVHIVHVTSAQSLRLIEAARKEGLPLTAETCPHYLYFDEEHIPDAKTIYKCAPPIRNKANNNRLKEALQTGLLDFIATDHSPAPPDIKEISSGNLKKAWGGIAGLQFFLPASWTALKGLLSLEQFIPLVTEKPAAFLRINDRKGYIRPGFDADLVIWSNGVSVKIREEDILHRHKACPYTGEFLSGAVQMTMVNGRVVFDSRLEYFDKTEKNAGQWLLQK